FKVRAKATETLEPLRKAGTIGKSLDAVLTLSGGSGEPVWPALEKHRDFLPEFLIVSRVTLEPKNNAAVDITAQRAEETGHHRCPRCWRWVPALVAGAHGDTCPRCVAALQP
nr:isoleucine--tRNA ligase [Verrucomicrobiota bacterium]